MLWMSRSLSSLVWSTSRISRWFGRGPWWAPAAPELQLAGPLEFIPPPSELPCPQEESIWFAVPKQKVSRSKKRMKTTLRKRIKLKQNIVKDPQTGETTLMHKLPFNWKDYVPKFD